MAGPKIGLAGNCKRLRQSLNLSVATIGFLMVSNVASSKLLSQELVQWKQSIERPSLDWDYDGERILGHVGYDICLWDATTGELLHRMEGHKERIHKVQFSPDGEHAISSSWAPPGPMLPIISRDTRVILWNLRTGRECNSFQGQVAGEFSTDGKRIVTFSQRIGTGQPDLAWAESTLPSTGEIWQVGSAAKFDAAVWETFTGRQVSKVKLDEHSDPYRDALHFSPDGRRFIQVDSNEAVLFDASDGREIGRASGKYGIHRYTSAGAFACFDRESASLVDMVSGWTLQSIEHGLRANWSGAWTHDGRKVAAFPAEGAFKIWDLESGKTIPGAKAGIYPRHTVIISPDNSHLAIAWGGVHVDQREVDPEFGLYDMNTAAEIAVIERDKHASLLGFSPDSKTLLVGGSAYDRYVSESNKRTVRPEFAIYNAENGKRIRTLTLLDRARPLGRNE